MAIQDLRARSERVSSNMELHLQRNTFGAIYKHFLILLSVRISCARLCKAVGITASQMPSMQTVKFKRIWTPHPKFLSIYTSASIQRVNSKWEMVNLSLGSSARWDRRYLSAIIVSKMQAILAADLTFKRSMSPREEQWETDPVLTKEINRLKVREEQLLTMTMLSLSLTQTNP